MEHERREIPMSERRPIGDVILGMRDPREMTKEEFEKSPDILFHGSATPLEFRPVFNFRDDEYLRENDGSTTLGNGFYTTSSREDAECYSGVRKSQGETRQFVSEVLPFNARVLDLRWKDDKSKNAAVPTELAKAWTEYFSQYLKTRKPRENTWLGSMIEQMETDYPNFLQRALKEDSIDLRVLLQTSPHPKLQSKNLPSPVWSLLFSEFMISQGYDGLIYNEGGEGWNANDATRVFYNLKKIGTFESWQKGEGYDE
ncbi:hypothetical protein A2318_03575 [Candidatus Uhrbacteria bacterium RIFOXYB2_FULL_45_11]|uniref:Uncharacterized protein n=1 Tax=Candidatus Uhrbacteria bacterium RIFOXYB2_FULL_45_11 TaxID=1802421 RepID=A0A1F7W3Q9_9BACT|nr:MAG: hypothetical protein A2318_03575 [Candidatus Uhrbacteria bacterium RIFOXYB2_FULL_45_11]